MVAFGHHSTPQKQKAHWARKNLDYYEDIYHRHNSEQDVRGAVDCETESSDSDEEASRNTIQKKAEKKAAKKQARGKGLLDKKVQEEPEETRSAMIQRVLSRSSGSAAGVEQFISELRQAAGGGLDTQAGRGAESQVGERSEPRERSLSVIIDLTQDDDHDQDGLIQEDSDEYEDALFVRAYRQGSRKGQMPLGVAFGKQEPEHHKPEHRESEDQQEAGMFDLDHTDLNMIDPDLADPDMIDPDLMEPDMIDLDLLEPDMIDPDLLDEEQQDSNLLDEEQQDPDLLDEEQQSLEPESEPEQHAPVTHSKFGLFKVSPSPSRPTKRRRQNSQALDGRPVKRVAREYNLRTRSVVGKSSEQTSEKTSSKKGAKLSRASKKTLSSEQVPERPLTRSRTKSMVQQVSGPLTRSRIKSLEASAGKGQTGEKVQKNEKVEKVQKNQKAEKVQKSRKRRPSQENVEQTANKRACASENKLRGNRPGLRSWKSDQQTMGRRVLEMVLI